MVTMAVTAFGSGECKLPLSRKAAWPLNGTEHRRLSECGKWSTTHQQLINADAPARPVRDDQFTQLDGPSATLCLSLTSLCCS